MDVFVAVFVELLVAVSVCVLVGVAVEVEVAVLVAVLVEVIVFVAVAVLVEPQTHCPPAPKRLATPKKKASVMFLAFFVEGLPFWSTPVAELT